MNPSSAKLVISRLYRAGIARGRGPQDGLNLIVNQLGALDFFRGCELSAEGNEILKEAPDVWIGNDDGGNAGHAAGWTFGRNEPAGLVDEDSNSMTG